MCRAHGVPLGEVVDDKTGDVSDEALHFDDLDVALRFCELSFLKVGAGADLPLWHESDNRLVWEPVAHLTSLI